MIISTDLTCVNFTASRLTHREIAEKNKRSSERQRKLITIIKAATQHTSIIAVAVAYVIGHTSLP